MKDYDCNFVSFEGEDAINSRIGSNFIVLQEKYLLLMLQGYKSSVTTMVATAL